MTKSAIATPGLTEGQVSTVKMDGSWEEGQREGGEEGGGEGGGEGERERGGKERKAQNASQCNWVTLQHTFSWTTHCMVKRYGIDRHKVGKVVLVREVVPVPCDHIKGRVGLHKQQWGAKCLHGQQ